MCVLKCFSRFEMRFYIQYRFVSKLFAFEILCVKERNPTIWYFSHKLDSLVVFLCLFNEWRDLVFVYIPNREYIVNIPFPD